MARLYPQKKYKRLIKPLLILLVAAIVGALIISGVNSTSKSMDDTQYEILKQSIKSALICCYAIEGRYPLSLGYLEENYGVTYDHEKYSIIYEVIAKNSMPGFSVKIRGEM